MPPRVKLLIADLGLRYRPTAAADLEAHATMLGLLALDVADLPPDRLERAINAWVRAERWMPKASELVALCQQHQRAEIEPHLRAAQQHDSAAAFVDSRNALLAAGANTRKDIEWYVDHAGEPKLRFKRDDPKPLDRVDPADVPRLNRALAKYGAPFRYDQHGRDYDVPRGASNNPNEDSPL